uniref:Carboxypeptidase n=1 Tax=Brassica campestris TaxID=3711 RepID=M4DEG6_BRACM
MIQFHKPISTTYSWTKWLDKHPEYFSNPFYVTGNSYSGKVIPAIVQEISNGNYICCEPQINLQGYVLGNPVTNFDIDNNTRIPFAHGMALISDELYESMKKRCGGNYFNVDPQNTECLELVKDYKKTYWYSLSEYWANNESVRRALRVVKGGGHTL